MILRPLLCLLLLSAYAQSQVQDFWFSGAEVNKYQLKQSRYGEEHPGHAEFIFVTEPFLTDKQVKNESGAAASTNVLKLNALRTFNTGIYSYRTMTSTFRPIDLNTYPHAFKSTTSVQDWCGQAFQQLNWKNNSWQAQVRSYFETPGDENVTLPDAVLEDELWLLIRLDPKKLPTGSFKAIPGAVVSRLFHIPLAAYSAKATLQTDAGKLVYTITYPRLKRSLSMTADADFPHIIREWTESKEGEKSRTHAKLTHRIMNAEYWSQHNLKYAGLRRKLGLIPEAK